MMLGNYCDKIEYLIKDSDEYIKIKLRENFDKYINLKLKQGMGNEEIIKNLAEPSIIADKYLFYSKLYPLMNKKRLKGASKLVKHALKKGILSANRYNTKKANCILKCLLLFICGSIAIVLSFLLGDIIKIQTINTLISLLLTVFFFGCYLIYKIIDVRHKFLYGMLKDTVEGCDLENFNKDII